MEASQRNKLTYYGERAYIGAWALEIVASIIGLATGIALAFRGYKDADASNFNEMDFVLASAPYFMVAIAELTKIPIATLLFYSRWIWKPIVLIFLLGMAAITFETVYAGLDRALTVRKDRYDKLLQQITVLNGTAAEINQRMKDTSADEQLRRAKDNYNELAAQSTADHNKLAASLASVEKQLQTAGVLSPDAAKLADQINSVSSDREKLLNERDRSIKDNMGEFERQRSSFDERIKNAQQRNDTDAIKRIQQQEDALANPRSKIEQQYLPRLDGLDKQIAILKADFEKKQAETDPTTSPERQKLQRRRDEIANELALSDTKWETSLTVASKQIDDAQLLKTKATTASYGLSEKHDEIRTKLSGLDEDRIKAAREDQIRRIAARFYGVKPEEVSNERVDLVSNIWFGSLALLAALAGPMTALVSLELQSLASKSEHQSQGPLARLVRRMLLSWRWRRVRTVKAPYPVTVEKEVEKRVEVPVERVIKEILYVPILTDDPEAVRRAIGETLEKEVADLVKISLARPAHGSPA